MFELAESERRQLPIASAIRAACTAVECRKTADGMSLAARAYSDRGSRVLDELCAVNEGVGAPSSRVDQMPCSSRAVRPISSFAIDAKSSSRPSNSP